MSLNSKKLKINRIFPFNQEAHLQPEMKDWFNAASRSYGAFYEKTSTRIATGLSDPEIDFLIPILVNVSKNDPKYREHANNFFKEVTISVPPQGLELEIGLVKSNTDPISEENLPLNPSDYVKYKLSIIHPQVALSEKLAKGNSLKHYYIVDSESILKDEAQTMQNKDNALIVYLQIKDDTAKVEKTLVLMGLNPKNLNATQRVIELKKLAENKPSAFIAVSNDKDAETKFFIANLISAQILEQKGTFYLIKETGDQIGTDLKEAVLYITDKKNSQQVNVFKAQLGELSK
jgi:hypothetical protein